MIVSPVAPSPLVPDLPFLAPCSSPAYLLLTEVGRFVDSSATSSLLGGPALELPQGVRVRRDG